MFSLAHRNLCDTHETFLFKRVGHQPIRFHRAFVGYNVIRVVEVQRIYLLIRRE